MVRSEKDRQPDQWVEPRRWTFSLRDVVSFFVIGFVIFGAVLLFNQGKSEAGQYQSITLPTGLELGPPPQVGKAAPDFTVRTLDGESLRLQDLRGQPVWINFWATWCPPCRAEAPDLQAVYAEESSKGLTVVAISIGEDTETVRAYVKRVGFTFTIGLDQTIAIAARYRIMGIPTHIFVDREGIIQAIRVGGLSREAMKEMVAKIL
ncbi:MAG: TlpA family protein disulfide reductase [Chloroflexi bacterium]|nr:TlpA family protein disulfide reductase [Chloroflexota bacterium]